MKQHIIAVVLMTTVFLTVVTNLTAQPNWVVNPPDFEYTMTVVGIGLFQCEQSQDQGDMVAAFIDDEIRGVQHLDYDVNGSNYAFMIVYNNDFAADEITFKLYNAAQDSIYETLDVIPFEENSNWGDIENPFRFKTDEELTDLILDNNLISNATIAGTAVSELSTLNENGDSPAVVFFDFIDDSLGVDNSYFSIVGSSLILENDTAIDTRTSYQIHVNATTDIGCTLDSVYVLIVNDDNPVGTSKPIGLPDDIRIYPNPASDQLFIDTKQKIEHLTISIFSITGRQVRFLEFEEGSQIVEIPLSNLAAGIYTVQLGSGRELFAKRLIIE